MNKGLDFTYAPIDISDGALTSLLNFLQLKFEASKHDLKVIPVCGDNMQGLKFLTSQTPYPNLVLFLGSSIGNTSFESNLLFLQELWHRMNNGDIAMIGFDLKKNPHTLNLAYDDPYNVTKEFNYNLLERINRELGANFKRDLFQHHCLYNPQTGAMESWLMSTEEQDVYIKELKMKVHFREWEGIHVENSFKYTLDDIQRLAKSTGFEVVTHLFDSKQRFVSSIWRVNKS